MRLWIGLLLTGLLLTSASAPAQTVVVVGAAQAPEIHGLRLDGSLFDSEELRGKTVLLDFWGTWCAPCIAAFPKLSQIQNELGGENFQVLGLAFESGTPEEVAEFLSAHDLSYSVIVVDEPVADAFEIDYFPTYVLIGPDGTQLEKYEGQQTDLRRRVTRRLAESD